MILYTIFIKLIETNNNWSIGVLYEEALDIEAAVGRCFQNRCY